MTKDREQIDAEWEKFRHYIKREEIPGRTVLLEESWALKKCLDLK